MWIPTWLFVLLIAILLGTLIGVFVLPYLRAPVRHRQPDRTTVPDVVPLLDELTGLWIRGRVSEGWRRTQLALTRYTDPAIRRVLHRWRVRWAGRMGQFTELRHALALRPWPGAHPESAYWEGITRADPEHWFRTWQTWQDDLGPAGVQRALVDCMDQGAFVRAWDIWVAYWRTDPERALQIVAPLDLIRNASQEAWQAGDRERLRDMIRWLLEHAPESPLGYYWTFQMHRDRRFAHAETWLLRGIRRTDHYWLYRTLESAYLDERQPQDVESFYVRRLHETDRPVRGKVLWMLYCLRVEKIEWAATLLGELESALQYWPMYWAWRGYVAHQQRRPEDAQHAWARFWHLLRRSTDPQWPFACEVCGVGELRWAYRCPNCHRLGTMDLRVPRVTVPSPVDFLKEAWSRSTPSSPVVGR